MMSREQKEDDMGEMMQGVTIFTSEQQQQNQQQQEEQQHRQQQQATTQRPVPLLLLGIVVIKLQLVPYLDNNDRGALFNSCRYLRPLKQTEFIYKFNRSVSFKYATDTAFRELVHQSAAINQQKTGKRMISIDLSNNQDIVDVSMISEVMELNITYCDGVIDVTALGEGQMLYLEGCNNVAHLDVFIRRIIAVLNPISAAAAADITAAETRKISYARECVAFTLGSLACGSSSIPNGPNQDLIAAEGGIPALTALINDESDRSSVKAKKLAVLALQNLALRNEANKRLISDAGGMIALIAMLTDDSDHSNAETKQWAVQALGSLAYDSESTKQLIVNKGGITALVAVLKDTTDRSSADVKQWAAHALNNLAARDENRKQRIADEEGCIAAFVAILTDVTSDRSSTDARKEAALALLNLCYRNESRKQLIADAGGIPALITAARANAGRIHCDGFAKYALQMMSSGENLEARIRSAGGGEFL